MRHSRRRQEAEGKTRKKEGEGGKYPNVIIEILSNSTAKVDRTAKKDLYQNIFRTPDYFWFDPNSLEFAGFSLTQGKYEAITANEQGHLWSKELGLYLGVLDGKLRYFTPEGELVPTPQESALQERLAKEQEKLAKEEAQHRIEQLAEKLRELGINPDDVL